MRIKLIRKKFIIVILIAAMLTSALPVLVTAESTDFKTVVLNTGQQPIIEDAIYDRGELYIDASEFSKFTRYQFLEDKSMFIVQGQNYKKAKKYVVIDTAEKKIRVNLSDKVLKLSGYYKIDGKLYLPLCQLLPILNAEIEEIKDGQIIISNNSISLAEVLYDFDINDYCFNISSEFDDGKSNANSVFVHNYIFDTLTSNLNRVDVIFNSGKYEDYMDCFSELINESDLYNKAMCEEDDVKKMLSSLKGINKNAGILEDFYGLLEEANTLDLGPENVDKLLNLLHNAGAASELDADEMRQLSKVWSGNKISVSKVIKAFDYIYSYLNVVGDNYKMLDAIYKVDDYKIYNTSDAQVDACLTEIKAAKRTYELYSDQVVVPLAKEITRKYITKEITNKILDVMSIYKTVISVSGKLFSQILPYNPGDIAKLPLWSEMVLEGIQSYHHYSLETDSQADKKRLSLIFALLASRKCFSIMDDKSPSDYYKSKISQIDNVVMALYLDAANIKFDSYEHFSEFKRNNFKKIKSAEDDLFNNKRLNVYNSLGTWETGYNKVVIKNISDDKVNFDLYFYEPIKELNPGQYFDIQCLYPLTDIWATFTDDNVATFEKPFGFWNYGDKGPCLEGIIIFDNNSIIMEFKDKEDLDSLSDFVDDTKLTFNRSKRIINPDKYIGKTVREIKNEFGNGYVYDGFKGSFGFGYPHIGVHFFYRMDYNEEGDNRIWGMRIFNEYPMLTNGMQAIMTYEDIKKNFKNIKLDIFSDKPDSDQTIYCVSAESDDCSLTYEWFDEDPRKGGKAHVLWLAPSK